MGPCPWFMLVWWGKAGMPISWGCKWDLSIPTKSQMRETSEECTGNALAQNKSHITPAWYLRLSCRSGKPQLLGEAGCNWGSSEGCSLFPWCYRGFPAADQVGKHNSHIALASLTLRLSLTPQSRSPFHQQALGIYLGSFCSLSLFATVYVILC